MLARFYFEASNDTRLTFQPPDTISRIRREVSLITDYRQYYVRDVYLVEPDPPQKYWRIERNQSFNRDGDFEVQYVAGRWVKVFNLKDIALFLIPEVSKRTLGWYIVIPMRNNRSEDLNTWTREITRSVGFTLTRDMPKGLKQSG